MPTYVYRCKSCGHEFEEFQKRKDDPLVLCPKCGKKTLVRLISGGAGVVFKGSGFYETDYKRSSASGKESSAEKKPGPAKKTDSGPASKPDGSPDSKPSESPAPKKPDSDNRPE